MKSYTVNELMYMEPVCMEQELISIIKAFFADRSKFGVVIENNSPSEYLSDAWIAISTACANNPDMPAVNAIWAALDKERRQARTIIRKFASANENMADADSEESYTIYDTTADTTADESYTQAEIRAVGYDVIADMAKSPKAQLDVQAARRFVDLLSQGISKYNAGEIAGLKRKTIDRICERMRIYWTE